LFCISIVLKLVARFWKWAECNQLPDNVVSFRTLAINSCVFLREGGHERVREKNRRWVKEWSEMKIRHRNGQLQP